MRSLVLALSLTLPVFSIAQSVETVIQKGHELAVIAVAVSPDSNFVVTGSRDKTAKLWEISTGREVRSFLGHEATVNAVQFSKDGKYLITSSSDKTARIWEVDSGKEIYATPADQEYITAVTFSPDGKFFVVAGYGDSATVVNTETKAIIHKIAVNADKGLGYGTNVAISPDGKLIAFGEDNRTANVYSTATFKKLNTFQPKEGYCGGCMTMVAFTADSRSLITAAQQGQVAKHDLTSEAVIVYQETIEDLCGLDISHDGLKILAATKNTVIIWDQISGKEIEKIEPKLTEEINETVFTMDNNAVVITSNDNTAVVWDVPKNKPKLVLTGFLNERDKGGLTYDQDNYWDSGIAKYVRFKNNLLITRDGKQLIKGKFGTKVKRWDIATGQALMEYTGHKKAVLCYDLSRDGKTLLTGGGDGKIMLWDVQTGDSLQSIQSYRHPILDIHFNEDETSVITSCWDASIKIHDLKTKKLLFYLDFRENGSAYNVVFSPGDLYFFTGQGNILRMWETDSKKFVRDFIGHQDLISSIHLSPDRQSLLTTSWDGSVRVWDIGSGLMTKRFKGHHGAVHTGIYSADGKYVYSGGADRLIRVWDVATSKLIQTFDGHKAEVTSLLLSSDNKLLISHSVDGATKFWDLATHREFFEHIHFGEKEWMVKNPAGYFNGTQEARRYIHFVDGLKTYGVDQFFDEFYRPDLLPKIFQSRGGPDELKGIKGKLDKSPPPLVKIAALPSTEAGKMEIYIRVTDQGAGAETLKFFHNGKSIPIRRGEFHLPKGKGTTAIYKDVISLVGGQNTFTASAVNDENVESGVASAEYFSETSSKTSVCYILAVGINQYKNPKMVLNYARPDAESFGALMNGKGNHLYKNISLNTLYDADASRENILKKLDELAAKVHQDDVFIFYYAGHGSMVDNQFFFIPTENSRLYDLSSLQKDAISASVIQDKFKNIQALKQLIIMDACQSGGSVEILATRGAAEEKAIAQLSRSAGIHVMASAGSEQFAAEFTELGHGLFTWLLIKALQGEADGAPKDGKVTIYELKSYLDDQVPEMTQKLKGKPQYPYTFSRGQDFPILIEE